MDKYNAVDGCPKCGCLTTFDRYIKDIQFGERIRRKCTRCDYLWWNTPLDAKEEKVPSSNKQNTQCQHSFDLNTGSCIHCGKTNYEINE